MIQWMVLGTMCLGLSFPILVSDSLSRGKYYQLKFKLKDEKSLDRYIGLYTRKTLDADMLICDENNKVIAKVAGSAGKYPDLFMFPGAGVYSAKVIAYSGEGPFLMVISGREELKTILQDVK